MRALLPAEISSHEMRVRIGWIFLLILGQIVSRSDRFRISGSMAVATSFWSDRFTFESSIRRACLALCDLERLRASLKLTATACDTQRLESLCGALYFED